MLQTPSFAAIALLGASIASALPLAARGAESGKLDDDPNWKYVDCYSNVPDPILDNAISYTNNVARCLSLAASQGYDFAGVTEGRICYAGTKVLPHATFVGAENCKMKCQSGQDCGGSGAIDIYEARNPTPPTKYAGPGFEYTGCYTDSVEQRTLRTYLRSYSWDPQTCVILAAQAGYKYAGVEYGGEWASNEISYPGAPQGSEHCNMPCNDNHDFTCGGVNSIDLYTNRQYVPTPPPPPPTPVNPAPVTSAGWTYQGCWVDSVSSRTLVHSLGSTHWTATHCLELAQAAGYKYGGVEYGGEWGANEILLPKWGDSTPCNMACNDAPSESCGGANAIEIYESNSFVAPPPLATLTKYSSHTSGWTYTGCFGDAVDARTLPNGLGAAHYTVADCLAAAQAAGFNIAGVEYGGECFAGNALPPTALSADKCEMACNDLSTQACGGPNALDVYTLTPPVQDARH